MFMSVSPPSAVFLECLIRFQLSCSYLLFLELLSLHLLVLVEGVWQHGPFLLWLRINRTGFCQLDYYWYVCCWIEPLKYSQGRVIDKMVIDVGNPLLMFSKALKCSSLSSPWFTVGCKMYCRSHTSILFLYNSVREIVSALHIPYIKTYKYKPLIKYSVPLYRYCTVSKYVSGSQNWKQLIVSPAVNVQHTNCRNRWEDFTFCLFES